MEVPLQLKQSQNGIHIGLLSRKCSLTWITFLIKSCTLKSFASKPHSQRYRDFILMEELSVYEIHSKLMKECQKKKSR